MTQTKSRDIVIREDELAPLLRQSSAAFGGWVLRLQEYPGDLDEATAITWLSHEAHALETFLDDFGARQNRTYVLVGELVASLRNIAAVKLILLHLRSRLNRYPSLVETGPLLADVEATNDLVNRWMLGLLKRLVVEADRFGIHWKGHQDSASPEVRQRRQLPRNLDEEEIGDEREHVALLGAKFLKIVETSRALDLGYRRPEEGLAAFVGEKASETQCRAYEASVHNIQSTYDTWVLHTTLERDHPWLTYLRGHASIALHLLEMATGLVHFFERHESDQRHPLVVEVIAAEVPPREVLQVAVNVCLHHAYLFVEAASPTAHQILRTFVRQATISLAMPEGVTLHARPLALIVQVARHYGTPLEISFDGDRCSAGSLMSLIMLGGRHPRPREICVQGDARALHDLELLFLCGLGETSKAFPAGLDYLRTGR